jgi:hypothetical protein
MRHLPLPTNQAGQPYAVGEAAQVCIDAIEQPQEFIGRITAIIPNIVAAETQYDQFARAATLHNFPQEDHVDGPNGTVTAGELKRLYAYRMRHENQPGRAIYNRLILSAGEICPLCGVREVKTLDHHLPQADYPILSVAPINLIPACRDCQSEKMEGFPTVAQDQTLHPYYDNVDGDIWLTAVVNHTQPASFTFDVNPPSTWTAITTARVRHHMTSFGLPGLFAMNAANELTGLRPCLTDVFNTGGGGAAAVQAELQSRVEGWQEGGLQAGRLNSWQLAMYQAAAADNWFCNQGFALV